MLTVGPVFLSLSRLGTLHVGSRVESHHDRMWRLTWTPTMGLDRHSWHGWHPWYTGSGTHHRHHGHLSRKEDWSIGTGLAYRLGLAGIGWWKGYKARMRVGVSSMVVESLGSGPIVPGTPLAPDGLLSHSALQSLSKMDHH